MAKVDAHVIQPEEYDEIPEVTDNDLARAVWRIGGHIVSEQEGRAAMAAAIRPGRPPASNPKRAVSIRLSPDVLDAFRAYPETSFSLLSSTPITRLRSGPRFKISPVAAMTE